MDLSHVTARQRAYFRSGATLPLPARRRALEALLRGLADREDALLAALEAGDLGGVARRMYNVFEDVLPPRQRDRVGELKNALIQAGALGANMSGTGPTAFGLFDSLAAAEEAWAALSESCRDTFLCQTV